MTLRAVATLTLVASSIGACVSQAPAPSVTRAIALKNPGFEEPAGPERNYAAGWDCTMHADPRSFRFFHDEASPAAGKASLCIEPSGKEPWALASQGVFDIAALQGARVRFSAAIRVDAVSGDGAGPYIVARGAALAHDKCLVSGTQGWQRVAVKIDVPAQAPFIEVGVALEGRGRVCFDDAILEIVRGPKSPV